MSLALTPRFVLVRGLAHSFAQALSQETPKEAIDVNLAQQQHDNYTRCLAELGPELIEIEADERYPDCCFIEDTVVVVGSMAILTRIGALSRAGEVTAVRKALQSLQERVPQLVIHSLQEPAQLDGGDVLQMGDKVFIGLSQRTNQAAIDQMQALLPGRVVAVPVGEGLHLKSLLSALDDETLILADCPAARAMADVIQRSFLTSPRCVMVPDREAANVLCIGDNLMIQADFPQSETILKNIATEKGLSVRTLRMSELIKADGALTCCSVLISF